MDGQILWLPEDVHAEIIELAGLGVASRSAVICKKWRGAYNRTGVVLSTTYLLCTHAPRSRLPERPVEELVPHQLWGLAERTSRPPMFRLGQRSTFDTLCDLRQQGTEAVIRQGQKATHNSPQAGQIKAGCGCGRSTSAISRLLVAASALEARDRAGLAQRKSEHWHWPQM